MSYSPLSDTEFSVRGFSSPGKGGVLSINRDASPASPSSTAVSPAPPKLSSSIAIAFLCFSCVAGGPFGIEVAVQTGGAFATVLGLIAAGMCWGLPQALITAELSSALPSNGGPIVWVRRALGERVSHVNCLLVVFNQLTDTVLYPTLFASYVSQLLPVGPWGLYALKLTALLAAAGLNVVGIEALSVSAFFLTAFIMAPFLLIPIVAAATGASFDWSAVGPSGTPPSFAIGGGGFAVFFSTVLWNMQVCLAFSPFVVSRTLTHLPPPFFRGGAKSAALLGRFVVTVCALVVSRT